MARSSDIELSAADVVRDGVQVKSAGQRVPGIGILKDPSVRRQELAFADINTNIPGGGRFSGEQSQAFMDANTNIPGGGNLNLNSPVNMPTNVPTQEPTPDRRIRIRAKTSAAKQRVYGENSKNNVLSSLYRTNGVIFPYTPTITLNQSADWSPYDLTHVNYQTQSYSRSQVEDFVIAGEFSAQNDEEAKYLYTALHFFRSMTKMYFGASDSQRGATPPVLALSGYGKGMFNDVPVVIKSVSADFNNQIDMVQTVFPSGLDVWVPTLMTISVTVGVSYDGRRVRDEFNLAQFKSGNLLINNRGFF